MYSHTVVTVVVVSSGRKLSCVAGCLGHWHVTQNIGCVNLHIFFFSLSLRTKNVSRLWMYVFGSRWNVAVVYHPIYYFFTCWNRQDHFERRHFTIAVIVPVTCNRICTVQHQSFFSLFSSSHLPIFSFSQNQPNWQLFILYSFDSFNHI